MLSPKQSKPRGIVTPLTPVEIAQLAAITPQDIENVKTELVPELRELLNAIPSKPKNAKSKD